MMYRMPRRLEPNQDTYASEAEGTPDEQRLWRYRLDRLMEMGFDFEDSEELIAALSQGGLDWHYVKETLLDHGCTLKQAKRILAQL